MSRVRQASHLLWVPIALTALGLAGSAGCGSGMPRTYPVKGRVVFKGGKAVTDGRIEFQSTSDATVRASGEIERDGTFSLTTYREGKTAQGAVQGPHKVVIELERPRAVVAVQKVYTVEPGENDFTVEIPVPRR